jgi:hypothetical protein
MSFWNGTTAGMNEIRKLEYFDGERTNEQWDGVIPLNEQM